MSVLEGSKITFNQAIMYKTVSNEISAEELQDYDMLIFFTPSGVKSLKENFPNFVQGDVKFACFGEAAANAIEENGFRLDLKAPTAEAKSMTGALELYLEQLQGEKE